MSDLNKIIEDLSKLTVVEAAELSKQLEEKWGVTAAAPAAAVVAGGAAPAAEEKSEFSLFLAAAGDKKIGISVRCTDLFHTQRRNYDLIGSNFEVNSRFNRQSRLLYFGITFRPFRNHKKTEETEEEQDDDSEKNED